MKVKMYPKVRYLITPVTVKWGEFEPVTIEWLFDHFRNYWPGLTLQFTDNLDYIEINITKWFYNRYMQCYDHQILQNGKWINGIQKL